MTTNEKSTEEIILEAARKIFIEKGMEGARMQEIADEAGINKALLHYYFRSKEKLFLKVFEQVFTQLILNVKVFSLSDISIYQKIESFISIYIDLIKENPFVPVFIIGELNRDPKNLLATVGGYINTLRRDSLGQFISEIESATSAGTIKPISVNHLIVNILSMCIFPAVAYPMIREVLFEGNFEETGAFYAERKEKVIEFVMSSICMK